MPRFLNMVRMATSTLGTGSTLQLGPAVEGFNTFADGGAVDGDDIYCAIEEKTNNEPTRREVGIYTYSAAGPSFTTRTVLDSTDGGNPIDLKGGAQIFSTPVRQGIFSPPAAQPANTVFAAPNGSTGIPSFRTLVAADLPPQLFLVIVPSGDTSGVTDVANINAALTAANTAGYAAVYMARGVWSTNATINLTNYNITLAGVGSDGTNGTIVHGLANAPMFKVSGDVVNWGLRSLFVKTINAGSSAIGIQIGSSQLGLLSDIQVEIGASNQIGVLVDANDGGSGVISNQFNNLNIYLGPTAASSIGIKLTGSASINTNTNYFNGLGIQVNASTQTAIALAACDGNVFVNTNIVGGTPVTPIIISQDFSINSTWPSGNSFFQTDFGFGLTGGSYPVTGSPSVSSYNVMYGFDTGNGAAIPHAGLLRVMDTYSDVWTPQFQGSTSNPTVTYTQQIGHYSRTGDVVTMSARIAVSAYSGGTGDLQITLPFVSDGSGGVAFYSYGAAVGKFTFTGYTQILLEAIWGSALADIVKLADGSVANTIGVADITTGTFVFSLTYRTSDP